MISWSCIAVFGTALALPPQSLPAKDAAVPPPPSAAEASAPQPLELDHVVASVGTNVILQSDVQLEMRLSALEPLRVLPGQNTPARALRRLIDRTLILEQMNLQQQPVTISAPELDASLEELRTQIPDCARFHCETAQGWEAFLQSLDLTDAIVRQRWSQRTAILRFINLRFQSGIRITPDEISAYYEKVLLPALAKAHQNVPPLKAVSARIQEILLQQQVSGLFQDWLSSLRDQGDIRIVDAAYSADLDLRRSQENPQ